VPRHLAERILKSEAILQGERKQVTVLFADVKGSMELLADRDPEEARSILDPVICHMIDAVHRYEGTVNQVMGDGIMALFGAPLAHEDHAVRACYAALRLQEAIRRYTEDVRRTHGIEVQVRVGLNSGEVVVGSIGSDLRMEYTAVGQTTHLAARMEQLAAPGTIRLTADTLALAEHYVTVRSLGPVPVRGLEAPVEVYELVGAGRARSRLQVSAARGLTRFVGRDPELEHLSQALALAGAGHGQVVALVGEPGVGKSRLYWEFTRSHRTAGWLIVATNSVSYGHATPYLPVIDLLKAYAQIDATDEPRRVREKLTGKILSLDRTLEPFLAPLLSLLDVGPDDPAWDSLEPTHRRQLILDGVKRVVLRESQVQPLVLLFEDLHWIDAETQALLDSLVESLPTARILLLVNYRPEYQHGWGSKTYYRQLPIEPLPPERAEVLLDELLGRDASLSSLKQRIVERTDGNPFFLEEIVRGLIEGKVLEGDRGAYRLARTATSVQIPATAQALLASRIDRLAPEDKRVLQSAAVIGKDVPFMLLQALVEAPEHGLRSTLDTLQAAEFLYETQLFPELEYTFKHALTQEVAYRSLPLERRRTAHERIASVLETMYATRLDEKAELLAYHYDQGRNTEKALVYLARAAEKATARFAPEEASRYYDAVIACLQELPRTEARERQRIDLGLGQVDVLWFRGDYLAGRRILEEARAIAERLGDLPRLALIHFKLGWYLYDQMDLDGAFAHQRECFALCERLGRLSEMRQVYWGLGQSCRSVSSDVEMRRRTAIEYHRTGLELAERAAPPVIFWDLHNAHFLWLIHLFQLGDWHAAHGYLERAERIARAFPEGSDTVQMELTKGSLGLSHLLRGDGDAEVGLTFLRESLAAAESVASHIYTTIGRYLLAQGYFLVGDLPRALSEFTATLAVADKTGNLFLPGALVSTAETEARLGRADEAAEHVARYEALVRDVGPLEGLAWFPSRGAAERVHGLVLARRGDVEAAIRRLDQSVATLTEHGYRPDLARTLVALGQIHRDHGQPSEARIALERAAELFSGMGFGREHEQTLALL
jgi:class 3 adenylate cyclase/tetratricopeptide (TPR) repeat protein